MRIGRLFTVVAAAFILVSAGSCGKKENILVNGDFEQQVSLEKSPDGWYPTIVPQLKEFVSFEWDDQVAHFGERSVSLAIDSSHPEEQVHYNWAKTVPACEPGRTYEMSGWIKTENLTTTAVIMLQFWNKDMNGFEGTATTQVDYKITGTSDWTKVGTQFTIPEGTAVVYIRAGIAAPENRGGKAWFDDLSIREVN